MVLAPFTVKGFYLLTWGTALGSNVWNTVVSDMGMVRDYADRRNLLVSSHSPCLAASRLASHETTSHSSYRPHYSYHPHSPATRRTNPSHAKLSVPSNPAFNPSTSLSKPSLPPHSSSPTYGSTRLSSRPRSSSHTGPHARKADRDFSSSPRSLRPLSTG